MINQKNILLLNNIKILLLKNDKNCYFNYNKASYSSLFNTINLSTRLITPISKPNIKKSKWISSTFKLFTNLSSYNRKHLLRVHHSYTLDGFVNGSGNGGFSNLKIFFNLYSKFFTVIFTLVYYNIQRLVFSNNVFREEACALNWENLSKHLFIWKYNYHSLFYKPSKLDDKLPLTFLLFKQAGINSGIIIDSLYHAKTIYYLHRAEFYSIGLVEGNKSKYLLNTTLPALGESILSQLFFIRMISIISKLSSLK